MRIMCASKGGGMNSRQSARIVMHFDGSGSEFTSGTFDQRVALEKRTPPIDLETILPTHATGPVATLEREPLDALVTPLTRDERAEGGRLPQGSDELVIVPLRDERVVHTLLDDQIVVEAGEVDHDRARLADEDKNLLDLFPESAALGEQVLDLRAVHDVHGAEVGGHNEVPWGLDLLGREPVREGVVVTAQLRVFDEVLGRELFDQTESVGLDALVIIEEVLGFDHGVCAGDGGPVLVEKQQGCHGGLLGVGENAAFRSEIRRLRIAQKRRFVNVI